MRELAWTLAVGAVLVASLVIRIPVPAWVSPDPIPIFAVVEMVVLGFAIPTMAIGLLWFVALLVRDSLP